MLTRMNFNSSMAAVACVAMSSAALLAFNQTTSPLSDIVFLAKYI